MKTLIYIMAALVLPIATLYADETTEIECQEPEVKVCFTDGSEPSCYCKIRTVEITDTPDGNIPCYDQEDQGSC